MSTVIRTKSFDILEYRLVRAFAVVVFLNHDSFNKHQYWKQQQQNSQLIGRVHYTQTQLKKRKSDSLLSLITCEMSFLLFSLDKCHFACHGCTRCGCMREHFSRVKQNHMTNLHWHNYIWPKIVYSFFRMTLATFVLTHSFISLITIYRHILLPPQLPTACSLKIEWQTFSTCRNRIMNFFGFFARSLLFRWPVNTHNNLVQHFYILTQSLTSDLIVLVAFSPNKLHTALYI